MSRRPVPPHGTLGRRRGSQLRAPCACGPCVAAATLANKRWRLATKDGKAKIRVDPRPAAERIEQLLAEGWSQTCIAVAADVSRSSIRRILRRPALADRRVVFAILTVEPRNSWRQRPKAYVVPEGTVRRVRALLALGHAAEVIAASSGMSGSWVRALAAGGSVWVHAASAERIRTAYMSLAARPGGSRRTAARAAREGWAPPAAWDDETIDDPRAAPNWTGECGTWRGYDIHLRDGIRPCDRCRAAAAKDRRDRLASAASRTAVIAEDAQELFEQGLSREAAAARLGLTARGLEKALWRHRRAA